MNIPENKSIIAIGLPAELQDEYSLLKERSKTTCPELDTPFGWGHVTLAYLDNLQSDENLYMAIGIAAKYLGDVNGEIIRINRAGDFDQSNAWVNIRNFHLKANSENLAQIRKALNFDLLRYGIIKNYDKRTDSHLTVGRVVEPRDLPLNNARVRSLRNTLNFVDWTFRPNGLVVRTRNDMINLSLSSSVPEFLNKDSSPRSYTGLHSMRF